MGGAGAGAVAVPPLIRGAFPASRNCIALPKPGAARPDYERHSPPMTVALRHCPTSGKVRSVVKSAKPERICRAGQPKKVGARSVASGRPPREERKLCKLPPLFYSQCPAQ